MRQLTIVRMGTGREFATVSRAFECFLMWKQCAVASVNGGAEHVVMTRQMSRSQAPYCKESQEISLCLSQNGLLKRRTLP
jgi:hypothetical protein